MKKALLNTLIAAAAVFGSTQAMANGTFLGEFSVDNVFVNDLGTTQIQFHENLPISNSCGGNIKTIALQDTPSARDNAILQRKLELVMSSLKTKTKVGVHIYSDCVGTAPRAASIYSTNEYTQLIPSH